LCYPCKCLARYARSPIISVVDEENSAVRKNALHLKRVVDLSSAGDV